MNDMNVEVFNIVSNSKDWAPEYLSKKIAELSVSEIAWVISQDWKNVYFGAEPYLSAMYFHDYVMDSEKSIILYFLSNATTWRGKMARVVKAELKARANGK